MTWWQGVIGLLGVTLVPLLTWLAARSSAKNGRQSNHTADWSAFTQRMEAWTERQLKEQDERTEQELRARDIRIDRLEERLSAVEGKYRVAVAYIRRLVRQLQRHVDPDDIETPPPEISPDL